MRGHGRAKLRSGQDIQRLPRRLTALVRNVLIQLGWLNPCATVKDRLNRETHLRSMILSRYDLHLRAVGGIFAEHEVSGEVHT